MLDNILGTVLENGTFTGTTFLMVTVVSLVLGAVIALFYSRQNKTTNSFAVTLALLPAIVQLVILLVNGNIGAGVAVAGAFSLVRFRSVAGNAREITAVFLAMAVGLATGMGYIGIAAFFTVIISVLLLVCSKILSKKEEGERILKITVPEHLEFDGVFEEILDRSSDVCSSDLVFEDVLDKFTDEHKLENVKTTNMGSLYKLTYTIRMKPGTGVKEFLDCLREQNGNLEISCGYPVSKNNEL